MNKDEISKLLVIAMGIDSRMNVSDQNLFIARVEGWKLALRENMTFEFAKQAIGNHYANSTDSVMPAHLNAQWKSQVERNALKDQNKAISDRVAPKGMPESVRAELRRIGLLKP